MPAKNLPHGDDRDLKLATLSGLFSDEDKAREFLESKLWPDGPVCPHCDSTEAYALNGREGSKNPVPRGVYKCKKCRKKFTFRVGTIFEDSKVPLSRWLMAIHLMTSSKKGVSSHKIARDCGITQKSAWFLNHRIREALKMEPIASMLQGTVEKERSLWHLPPTQQEAPAWVLQRVRLRVEPPEGVGPRRMEAASRARKENASCRGNQKKGRP
jgi:transposase-like protein